MRINRVENCAAFGNLQTRVRYPYYLNESKIRTCEKKLESTKFIDVIFDSLGFAIKDKMTEVLYRFQSFSLFPVEKSIGIRMRGIEEPVYKFTYPTQADAKLDWENFLESTPKDPLEEYTSLALWLENKFRKQNRSSNS